MTPRTRGTGGVTRVFLGLTEVAGYYAHLREGLEGLGIRCTQLDLSAHPYQYRRAGRFERLLQRSGALASGGGWMAVLVGRPAFLVLRVLLFVWAALTHHAFIFGYGSSFFRHRELRLLRWLGRRIIFVFHGSDSRPPYLDGAVLRNSRGARAWIEQTAAIKGMLRRIERHAHVIIANPLSAHLHERPVVPFGLLGVPGPLLPPPAPPPRAAGPLRLLHCPSDPEGKGTEFIRSAVARLRDGGVAVELTEITGQPHRVVLEALARCDLVVDQLFSDVAMAGFAREAATYGRAAVVGSYGADVLRGGPWPGGDPPPTVLCHPEELDTTLRALASDPARVRELGRTTRDWVSRNWSAKSVAARYVRLLTGDPPEEWLIDPAGIRYVNGYGLPEARLRVRIRTILEEAGPGTLRLDDKPVLRQLLVEFAHTREGRDAAAIS